MNPIKVILFDFQFLTREGLMHLLGEDPAFDLMEVLEHSDDLKHSIVKHQPDVVILDYEEQKEDLNDLLEEIIKNEYPQVLVITNRDNKSHIRTLLDLGIRGIVTKGCSKMEIVNAIQSISIGNRFFCNRILDQVMTNPISEEVTCDPADLSPREFEVLNWITKGQRTVDIADKLNISVHTINSHRKNILKKLNLKSPAELIVYAMESGMTKV
ncbi:MAG: response regulator transcription factor [Cytophagales bacterium]|nr:response regulator transcription factor [Cytophagales bacterium]